MKILKKWTWEQWQWRSTLHSQNSSITGTLPSDCLVSYPGHLLVEGGDFNLSAEKQSEYFTTPADKVKQKLIAIDYFKIFIVN